MRARTGPVLVCLHWMSEHCAGQRSHIFTITLLGGKISTKQLLLLNCRLWTSPSPVRYYCDTLYITVISSNGTQI